MEKFIHKPSGEFVSDTPWYLTEGTRVKIVKLDNTIGVNRDLVGQEGVIAKLDVARNKEYQIEQLRKNEPRGQCIRATYGGDGGERWWCYKDMLEVIDG